MVWKFLTSPGIESDEVAEALSVIRLVPPPPSMLPVICEPGLSVIVSLPPAKIRLPITLEPFQLIKSMARPSRWCRSMLAIGS